MKKDKKYIKKSKEQELIKFQTKVVHNWSDYQKAIFVDINKGIGNTIVEAYAGSSKTTSLIQSLRYVPRNVSVLLLAFNKSIQKELENKAPQFAMKYTFHGLGFAAIKNRFGNDVEVDEYKANEIAKEVAQTSNYDLIFNLCKTVDYCKYSLVDTPSRIEKIIDNFNIDTIDLDEETFIKYVIEILKRSKADTKKVDYNDMCWFVYVYNLPVKTADIVIIDEYQDINAANIFIAKKARAKNGRTILYGDRLQNIYGFRLSDTSYKHELLKEENSKILTLPITYRCPKVVVELASLWAKGMTCPETAKDGNISEITLDNLYDKVQPGSYIISRKNAPLVKICMRLISLGKKANIKGKDIGKTLKFLINFSKKKTISSFLTWLADWKDKEKKKLLDKGIKIDNLIDRYECLVNICEESKDLEVAKRKIESIFSDLHEENMIILGSCHSLKGKESENVYVLKWTFMAWIENLMDESYSINDENQEMNLSYVAITRSKNNLFIVDKFTQEI